MKKRNLLLAVLLQAALLMNFASCSDDESSSDANEATGTTGTSDSSGTNGTSDSSGTSGTSGTTSKVVSKNLKLNIADATNLYIGNVAVSSSRAAVNSENRLFKITEDGYAQEISYTYEVTSEVEYDVPTYDEEGNQTGTKKETKTEVTTETASEAFLPTAISPVNDDYVLVTFNVSYKTVSYLVRKSDGAAFSMENVGNPDKISSSYKNEKLLKTDKNNNLYFLVYDYSSATYIKKVVKVNLSGIDSLSATTVSASTDYVYNFDVDWNGNVIYKGYLVSDSSNTVGRLRKANGGLANLSESRAWWIGLDGIIYYFNGEKYDSTTYTASYPIYKITVNSDGAINDTLYGNFEAYAYFYQDWSYKLELQNEILIIYASGNDSKIYEVYNESGTPRVVSLDSLSMKSVTAVASTENFYYIAGTDKSNNTFLIKVDPTDDSYTNLLPQNDYDVYSFTASETDGIIFNALRMSDGKKVIGKVGIDGGDVTMIDEESDVQITYLERIN